MQIPSLKFYSLILSSMSMFAWNSHYCGACLMVIFISLFSSALINWNSTEGRIVSFLTFIYFQVFFISLWTSKYFLLWVKIQQYRHLVSCSPCSSFGQWSPLQNDSRLLTTSLYVFLSTSLLSGTTRCPRLVFALLAPILESNTSPRSLDSFCWRMMFRNQEVCTRCAHCSWNVIASKSSLS